MRPALLFLPALLLAAAAPDPPARPRAARPRPSGQPEQAGQLEPVVPGSEGDPMRVELRDPRAELRVDDSFSGVYSVTGTPHYARRAHGLYAVFPRGEYVRYAGRDVAVLPAGTVYAIGSPDITASYGGEMDRTREYRRAAGMESMERPSAAPPRAPLEGGRSRLLHDRAYAAACVGDLLGTGGTGGR